ncbi:MAG: putative orfan [Satyrvirus sp.]|uniref:Putative orfan n=1 Tax=Satyrvirus sp. TaxID=2487771 RepID=A0A3G5AD48_9VIRU|nr:MAG: putative orfan [Satyrvirus sp.]
MNGCNIGNYKDFMIDIDAFDEENMVYIKPVLFYKVSKNIGIYYKKKIDKKSNKKRRQKIIVQSPKMIVPFDIKEFDNNGRKSYQICLSFSTLTNLYNEEHIKKFYHFIQKIDLVNEETIMEYKKLWNLPKNLKYKRTIKQPSGEYPHYMNISVPYDEKYGFFVRVDDENANKSNMEIISKRSIVSVIMELTDLKFTENEFRSNWTLMQIRKFKPYSPIQDFFMSACFICDDDNTEDTAYIQLIEKYRKTLQTPLNILAQMPSPLPDQAQNPIPPPPPPPIRAVPAVPAVPNSSKNMNKNRFSPTLDELLDAKKSLKKIVTTVRNQDIGKVLEKTNPPPAKESKNNKIKSKKIYK